MSLGKNPVKTFNSFLEARRWLQEHDWHFAGSRNIKRVIQKSGLSYGWRWEVLHRTKSLNDLLDANPTPEQIDEAKSLTRGYKKKQGAESVEFITKPIVEEAQSGCPNIDQAVQSSILSSELGQENQGEMERSEEETSAKEDETKKEIGISSLIDSTEPVAMEIRDSVVEKPMPPRQLECFDEFNVCKPSGLLNTNNQCFLNAIMQQLYRVKKFRKYILETEVLERENLIQYCLNEIFK